MRTAMDNRELTKIFVQCDQYTRLPKRAIQNLLVAWIFLPISGPQDIMTTCF